MSTAVPLHPLPLPDSDRRDCGSFFLDAVGHFVPGDVSVAWVDRPRQTGPEVELLIDRTWQQAVGQASSAGGIIFDGPLCRLAEHRLSARRMELALGPTSYRQFVGTNLALPRADYRHGPEVLADPLGVSGALSTSDGFLLLGRRSERVAHYPGRIHPLGGMVQPSPTPGAPPDLFGAMLAEVAQETGLPAERVRDILCLGLVRDKRTAQPEMVFDLTLQADADTVLRAWASAEDAHEHRQLVPVRNHPVAAVNFIQRHSDELTPVALAVLYLHGLRQWGSGWLVSARGYLRTVV